MYPFFVGHDIIGGQAHGAAADGGVEASAMSCDISNSFNRLKRRWLKKNSAILSDMHSVKAAFSQTLHKESILSFHHRNDVNIKINL